MLNFHVKKFFWAPLLGLFGCSGAQDAAFECAGLTAEEIREKVEAAVLNYDCGNYGNRYYIGRSNLPYPDYGENAPRNKPPFVKTCVLGELTLEVDDGGHAFVRAENAEGRAVSYFKVSGKVTFAYENGRFSCGPHLGRTDRPHECRLVTGVPVMDVFPEEAAGQGGVASAIFPGKNGSYNCNAEGCSIRTSGASLIRYRSSEGDEPIYVQANGPVTMRRNSSGSLECAPA